ncbi:MATE family efflux transporter [Larkinella humicola]|uniref:Multidrug-efflux transporter n=1 Tax=Larkinella humicola TaxID=2607654 RepID=A0A5N1JGW0_9BACT|nr:MATE family efflux transporter [Larkinella humicola]KAA9354615.1 MATE family efflux transporter [Larkinella humicola]
MKQWYQMYKPELADTIRLSIPIVIAQLGVVLMGVTDDLFVGRLLGAIPLAGAGLSVSLSFLVSSIGVGGLSVVAALVSQARGRNDAAEINRLFRAGLWVALWLGLALGLVGVGVAYFYDQFGQTLEVTEIGRNFLLILSLSNIPLFLFIAARQLCDGLSYPRIALIITLLALFLNALLNYVLIKGVGPFPALGVQGSALGTLLSRSFMAAAIILYIRRNSLFQCYFLPSFQTLGVSRHIRQILQLGLPGGFTFFFEVATFSLAAMMAGWLGTDQLAAHQIAINMASITYMMATGISAAGSIRVSRALGRSNLTAVRRAGVAALWLVFVFMGLPAVVFLTANDWLVSWYIRDNPEVAAIAASLVIMAGFFQLSDGIQVVGIGMLRGLSDVNTPTIISLFAYWIIGLPMSYVLGFWFNLGAIGIWIGLLAGLTMAAILFPIRFFRLVRQIKPDAVEKNVYNA